MAKVAIQPTLEGVVATQTIEMGGGWLIHNQNQTDG